MNTENNAPEVETLAADLSPALTAIEAAYRMIQAEYPDAPDVTIVIKRDSKAWGHTTVAQQWGDKTAEKAHRYEVMISGENLRRGAVDVASTLIHEAAHARDLNRGIRDTDVNGRHNLKFKAAAEEMGLTVENAGWHGWTTTTLSPEGLKRWRKLVARIEKGLARSVVALPPAPVMIVLPPMVGGGLAPVGGSGIAIAPPKRGGRRTLILAKCGCDVPNSIRLSQKVLDLARPKCQECDGLFVATA